MDLKLSGRTYVVTGGSRGLGLATAQALVAEGAKVVISARTTQGLNDAVEELGGREHAIGVAADIGKSESADLLVATAKESFGRLDGALLSVGGPPGGAMSDITDQQWRTSFESIFLGPLRLALKVAEAVTEGGAIAFVLSSSVRSPIAKLAISNGLRPGLAMAAKTLADELGPQGIRVFGLLPGRIDTDRTRELDSSDPKRRTNAEATIPLRRYGQPSEFGQVAAFLLSPLASYVTGVMVPIDGGVIRSL
ncbi:MAG TPA: SDR family oxidoreductase [Candidatus Nanopelagicaceae bacterium]